MVFLHLLLRLIVAFGILVVPFLVLALLSGTPDGMIVLIFPVLFTIPALLISLVVFAPVEWVLDWRGLGHWKNRLVPLAGGLAMTAGTNALWTLTGGYNAIEDLLRRPSATFMTFVVLGVLGALWGCFWRLTEWAAGLVIRRRAPRPTS